MASGRYEGHAAKRQKVGQDGPGIQRGQRDMFEDPHKPSPSPVVHVRSLAEHVIEGDLVDAVQQYGPISYVLTMPRKRMALIEFENIQGAINCVQEGSSKGIQVAGRRSYFNFSTSQKIERLSDEKSNNKILLFSILNPHYPITVEVMHTICQPHGKVVRIVIFKKTGLQSMVEFDSVEGAQKAKQTLHGQDIYSGCCTLKIDFAKTSRLNVFRNDDHSWDFENPTLAKQPLISSPKNTPLLQEPRRGEAPTLYEEAERRVYESYGAAYAGRGGGGGGDFGRGRPESAVGYSAYAQARASQPDRDQPYPPPSARGGGGPPRYYERFNRPGPAGDYPPRRERLPMDEYPRKPGGFGAGEGPPPLPCEQGCVLMCYGLEMDQANCQRLFNVLCLYGNVIRVRYLKSKEGTAMVQMSDRVACDRVLRSLQGVYLFGSKLQIAPSKQPYIQDVPNPIQLPDGSPAYMDYSTNKNNRFATQQAAMKNRICEPTKVLHYFNSPPNVDESVIRDVFVDRGIKAPENIVQFTPKTDRSSSGLLEFSSAEDCLEALYVCNHAEIANPDGSRRPYILKLCFSQSNSVPRVEEKEKDF